MRQERWCDLGNDGVRLGVGGGHGSAHERRERSAQAEELNVAEDGEHDARRGKEVACHGERKQQLAARNKIQHVRAPLPSRRVGAFDRRVRMRRGGQH
mmetsp:Transcript_10557/g.28085  ORF Transcript_10557/g.28085 Transcript_10557/m.28085 type:complete len:98 (-) Transcript_10557:760-1053(-)